MRVQRAETCSDHGRCGEDQGCREVRGAMLKVDHRTDEACKNYSGQACPMGLMLRQAHGPVHKGYHNDAAPQSRKSSEKASAQPDKEPF